MELKKLFAQSLLWRGLYFVSLLLVNIFLSRFLQAALAGWVFYLTNIFAFVQIIVSLSLESGITFFASGQIIRPNKLLWLSVAWSVVAGIIVLSVTFLYFHFLKPADIETQVQYCFFAVCYITGILLTNNAAVLFYAQHNFFLPNIIMVLLNFIFIILIPSHPESAALSQSNILYIYFLFFLLQGFLLSLAFIIKNKSYKQMYLPAPVETRALFRYSVVALAANIIFFLVYRIDYWFVHNSPVCTDSDLGNYIQVSKLGQLLLVVPQIIASVVFPRSASGVQRMELNTSLMIMARLFSQFFLLLIIIILLSGNSLFTAVFGESFNKMELPFIIILPGIFSLSVLTMLSSYFAGKGNLKVNVSGAALALIAVVAGDYFLVPVYGIVAAATVSTIGYIINLSYALFQFYKDYKINGIEFLRWRKTDYLWLKSLLIKNN